MNNTASLQPNMQLPAGFIETLRAKGYKPVVLTSEKEVISFINRIPNDGIIGLGDSITTCSLKIRNILAGKGSKIFYGWNGDDNYNRAIDTFENHPRPEYFLTRINAITLSGKILIKDFSRKAANENKFPKQIIAFAGINRIVDELNNNAESIHKYTVISDKPELVNFTIVLLPFMAY